MQNVAEAEEIFVALMWVCYVLFCDIGDVIRRPTRNAVCAPSL